MCRFIFRQFSFVPKRGRAGRWGVIGLWGGRVNLIWDIVWANVGCEARLVDWGGTFIVIPLLKSCVRNESQIGPSSLPSPSPGKQ
jgi:hypothetical protein